MKVENMSQYANAVDVLPKELLEKIRQYHRGMLYIPDDRNRDDTKKFVLSMFKNGIPSSEISMLSGLTKRRVNQIIQDHRSKKYER